MPFNVESASDNDRCRSGVRRQRPTYIPDYDTPRFRLTPAHSAYVKIAEGCNHPCSFCVIPQMRGKHRSRPPNRCWRKFGDSSAKVFARSI